MTAVLEPRAHRARSTASVREVRSSRPLYLPGTAAFIRLYDMTANMANFRSSMLVCNPRAARHASSPMRCSACCMALLCRRSEYAARPALHVVLTILIFPLHCRSGGSAPVIKRIRTDCGSIRW
jgi:hypothetical protein